MIGAGSERRRFSSLGCVNGKSIWQMPLGPCTTHHTSLYWQVFFDMSRPHGARKTWQHSDLKSLLVMAQAPISQPRRITESLLHFSLRITATSHRNAMTGV